MLTVFRVPLTELIRDNALPLTRDGVISIARGAAKDVPSELRIVVATDDGAEEWDTSIELATIELNVGADGSWRLQYISHPKQSNGLTAAIAPSESDFFAFIRLQAIVAAPELLTPLCAEELEEAGVGPLASLNLRLDNAFPLVPSKANLTQFVALLERVSTL